MDRVRVLLADDHRVVREGLRLVITAQPDMEVIGEADDGRVATALSMRLQPDIVVMDVSMPEMNGLRATERLTELCPATRVLMLTRHSDGGYVQPLLEAGAKGYVLKQSPSDELLRAIRAVASGFTYLDPAVTEPALGVGSGRGPGLANRAFKRLSQREEQVLRLIVRGMLNREVADRLGISIKTVETHKVNAMKKLGFTSRVDIIDYAILHGWLEND